MYIFYFIGHVFISYYTASSESFTNINQLYYSLMKYFKF